MTIMAAVATLTGSVGLYPLFEKGSWFWASVGAVLAVSGGGLLARRLRLPAVVNLVFGLAGLLLYLNLMYAGRDSWLLIPTPESLRHLADLANGGWQSANRYAAPVPVLPGIELMTAAGVGLVAVLVDLLAVRLRRTAPAGLPLLAMYSVPAAVRDDGVSWLAFGIGALGFLGLLMTDARDQVGGWGRAVTGRRQSEVPLAGAEPDRDERDRQAPQLDAAALAASGRRIAVGAIAVAVLVPAAVPGLQPRGMFGIGGDGGGATQTVTTPDPLVSLKRELTRLDDSIVLTYESNDTQAPDYLRLYALDKFEGDRWTYTDLDSQPKDRLDERDIPPPPGLSAVSSREVMTKIHVRPEVRNMTFLPVPYAPSKVSIGGDWRVDERSLMIYSLRDSAGGRDFTVRSRRAEPTTGQLAAAGNYPAEIVSRYTEVPKNVPTEVRQLAQDVTAGSATALSQAVRLQRWFTLSGGFTYDLSAPAPKHGSDLVDFLLRSKRGYCEQYAASMALMARILGIPSRVAMGYTSGSEVRPGEWVVRSRDAHAWPELYFEGTGWVRFEPTPSGAGGQGTADAPRYSLPAVTDGDGEEGETAPEQDDSTPTDDGAPTAQPSAPHRNDLDTGRGDGAGQDEGHEFSLTPWLAGGTLVLLLVAAPMALRELTRRRRWAGLAPPPPGAPPRPRAPSGSPRGGDPAGAAHAAWREMRADALDHGLEWRSSDSPRATARRLEATLKLDAEGALALGRIARAEELARYSLSPSTEPPERLRADVRTVREAFAASVGPGTRWRARLLPPSTVEQTRTTFQAAGNRALDVRTRLNRIPTRFTRH
ncbi:DUF3488 and transglutaminase-like domain-containing protein [Actinomadura meridiana]|uniref:DUF3488 and transglutaminase-like domain-containing protein n=2 Tax=Actinomadura meridiana TaxID=559626 RepID=A0ABP8BYU5_9ACTN